jgi:hypothetical protein
MDDDLIKIQAVEPDGDLADAGARGRVASAALGAGFYSPNPEETAHPPQSVRPLLASDVEADRVP